MKDLFEKMQDAFNKQFPSCNFSSLEIGKIKEDEQIITCMFDKIAGCFNLEDELFYF